jgi:hypothetical protein
MVNPNLHRQFDAGLQTNKVLALTPLYVPATGTNATSDGINIRSGVAYAYLVAGSQTSALLGNAAMENAELVLDIPAMSTHLDTSKHLYAVPYESDDNSTATAIASTAHGTTDGQKLTGIGTTGTPATQLRWKLPSSVKKYVHIYLSCTSGFEPAGSTFICTLSVVT